MGEGRSCGAGPAARAEAIRGLRPGATIDRRRLLVALSALALSGAAGGAPERLFRIGTGGIGGTYYPVGRLLAAVISGPHGGGGCLRRAPCGVPGLAAVVRTSEGSIANIEALAAGRLESALAQADVAYFAFHGEGPFAGRPLRGFRAVARLYDESLHLVVAPGSGIVTLAQIRGKRLSLDEEGSGTLWNVRLLLESIGVGEGEVRAVYVKAAEALDLLRRRELDGFFLMAGYPAASVSEATLELGARLVGVFGPAVDRLVARMPFLVHSVIPAGVYPGQPRIPTIGVGALWLVRADLDADLVYAITRALWDPRARGVLDAGHPKGREIRLERALRAVSVPLHPGAERYYRERGLL